MSRRWSYIASFTARVKAIYLTFVDDNATISYFWVLVYWSTINMKMKPKIDFWLFLSSIQSKSEYLSTMSLSWPPYIILCFLEPLKYYKMVFTTLVCWWPEFLRKQLTTGVANEISGLVFIIENIINLVIPCYISFSAAIALPLILSWSRIDFFIDILIVLALSK